jgi:acyl-CoA thioesterase-1
MVETMQNLLAAQRERLAAIILLACVVLGSSRLIADDAADERQKIYDQSLVDIEDEPGLPRVLLIGDSISIYYTQPARRMLKGKANLHHITVNGGDTDFGVKNIASWLGAGKWDVIQFNWGLHDIVIKPNGEHEVSLERYKTNLRELVRVLKQSNATLIWATTTPVPPIIKAGPTRSDADVITYNSAALAIMQSENIRLNDLYGLVLPRLNELQRPQNVHFTMEGSEVLAQRVAQVIEDALAAKHRSSSSRPVVSLASNWVMVAPR